MGARLNIVLIEDNDELRGAMVDALRAQGHEVLGLDSAEALPEQASWQRMDILVVDLNLPGEDGLSLVSRVRAIQADLGIIMVTARSLPSDKLAGYDLGADIYMIKPVPLVELNAAIRALGRRVHASVDRTVRLQLDVNRKMLHYVSVGDIPLSAQECALLSALARSADQRLETWQLIAILEKGAADDPKAALEITITRLRRKLEQVRCEELQIRSVRSWGYQLQGRIHLN